MKKNAKDQNGKWNMLVEHQDFYSDDYWWDIFLYRVIFPTSGSLVITTPQNRFKILKINAVPKY